MSGNCLLNHYTDPLIQISLFQHSIFQQFEEMAKLALRKAGWLPADIF